MSSAIVTMYAIAALAASIGIWLLIRLRTRTTPQARYASAIGGTMIAALGLILVIFATAQLSWERAASDTTPSNRYPE